MKILKKFGENIEKVSKNFKKILREFQENFENWYFKEILEK